jgi:hypothetical protein
MSEEKRPSEGNELDSCQGWKIYSATYPAKAKWLLEQVEEIKQHELCKVQFPEAMCAYTTVGVLIAARESKAQWPLVPVGGKLEGRFHFWLFDTVAKRHIDFTAHQFAVSGKRLKPCPLPIMVFSPEELGAYGYSSADPTMLDAWLLEEEAFYLSQRAAFRQARAKQANPRPDGPAHAGSSAWMFACPERSLLNPRPMGQRRTRSRGRAGSVRRN